MSRAFLLPSQSMDSGGVGGAFLIQGSGNEGMRYESIESPKRILWVSLPPLWAGDERGYHPGPAGKPTRGNKQPLVAVDYETGEPL